MPPSVVVVAVMAVMAAMLLGLRQGQRRCAGQQGHRKAQEREGTAGAPPADGRAPLMQTGPQVQSWRREVHTSLFGALTRGVDLAPGF